MGRDSGTRGDGRRIPRVEREMREVIGSYLISRLQGELEGFVSVSRVIVSKDLRQAKVMITVMGEGADPKVIIAQLKAHAPEIQSEVNRRLRMKYCPRITFLYDEGFENVLKVEKILQDLSQKRKKAEASESVSADEDSNEE